MNLAILLTPAEAVIGERQDLNSHSWDLCHREVVLPGAVNRLHSRRSIANVGLLEVAADLLRPTLRTPQKTPHIAHELPLVAGALSPDRIGLDILVEQLVGIQFRAVSRQAEEG